MTFIRWCKKCMKDTGHDGSGCCLDCSARFRRGASNLIKRVSLLEKQIEDLTGRVNQIEVEK